MPVLWHTVLPGQFFCKIENKDTIFQMEVVFDLSCEWCYCVCIVVNLILTEQVGISDTIRSEERRVTYLGDK